MYYKSSKIFRKNNLFFKLNIKKSVNKKQVKYLISHLNLNNYEFVTSFYVQKTILNEMDKIFMLLINELKLCFLLD